MLPAHHSPVQPAPQALQPARNSGVGGSRPESYFVSNNVKDFGDPSNQSRLYPELRAEIEGPKLHLITSVEHLLESLATYDEPLIGESFLTDNEECSRAVIRAVDDANLGALIQEIPGIPSEGAGVGSTLRSGPYAASWYQPDKRLSSPGPSHRDRIDKVEARYPCGNRNRNCSGLCCRAQRFAAANGLPARRRRRVEPDQPLQRIPAGAGLPIC